MNSIKAALFDVDGVLVNAPKLFSQIYSEQHGLDIKDLNHFFNGEFRDAQVGRADLKELIEKNRALWKYGQPNEILDSWQKSENFPDHELVSWITNARGRGLKAFIATDHEKYMAQYIYEHLFKNQFDGIFSSSELGFRKEQSNYWAALLKKLGSLGISNKHVVYFDDGANNIKAAKEAGVTSYLYAGIDQVKEVIG